MSTGLNEAAKTVLAHHLSRELGGEANDYTQIVEATNDHITPFFDTIIRQAKANAWDEGLEAERDYISAFNNWREHINDHRPEPPTNPYREDT